MQAVSDEHSKTPAAAEIVVSNGGETPKQESPTQHSSEHADNDGLDQQASELGEEYMDEVEDTANKGSPEPGEEEVTSEREDEGAHMTQEVLTGMYAGCIDLYPLPIINNYYTTLQFSDGDADSEWKELLQTFFEGHLLAKI